MDTILITIKVPQGYSVNSIKGFTLERDFTDTHSGIRIQQGWLKNLKLTLIGDALTVSNSLMKYLQGHGNRALLGSNKTKEKPFNLSL